MQKTILKLYLKNSKKPLFTAELLDDGEEILNELVRNLNDENIKRVFSWKDIERELI